MGENGFNEIHRDASSEEPGSGMSVTINGSSDSQHKHKSKHLRRETEEERRIRKEKEREMCKEGKRLETPEERAARKEKERKEKEERYRKEGRRLETPEERAKRKEKERLKKDGGRPETEEERAQRKERERHRKEGRRPETEEERRIRKDRERKEKEEKHRSRERHKETEEERRIRKEYERREKREREEEEETADDNYEEDVKQEVKEEPLSEDEADHQETDSMDDVEVKEEYEPDEKPLANKKSRSKKRKSEDEEEDDDYAPVSKKKKHNKIKQEIDDGEDFKPANSKQKLSASPVKQPETKGRKKVKKEEENVEVWKWWEEDKKDDGTKWSFLEHLGPLFPPSYVRLPSHVRFYYDGKAMALSEAAEEVATFYGKMLDHDYTTKEVFNKNFFKDWRKEMTDKEKEKIRDLSKCDFTEIDAYFKKLSEERKARSKEERKAEKEKNDAIQATYGFCTIDGHKEKIGNFRIEPPGLFRGRGEHPKQGMLKKRVMPEEVIINCSKDSKVPDAPEGRRWKEVRHDNTVTWLASWTENIQGLNKYVMLNPSSKLKGEKDMMKYEKARELKGKIHKIRDDYMIDFKSKEMRIRQRAVALYFIDKLALRAGNEKDEDQADTVGCCSLRVEHITLHPEKDGKEYCVEFDFLGKDSIRYNNTVPVEKRVYKNVQLFMDNKKPGDDLFDRLNTSVLNEYLNGLMPGLTAKVFRTYNASITLQEQLEKLTDPDDNIPSKVLSYNRANRQVAILCNHQRSVPKTHDKSMANLQNKVDLKREAIEKAEKEFKQAKKAFKSGGGGEGSKANVEKRKKAVERLLEQLNKMETQMTDKDENKTIALGTSKLNYLDPRISVAWVKKFDVPIEKVYNKTQREKFRWAIDMAGPDYVF